MDPLLAKKKKLYAVQFYQLKIRYGAIGTFFNKIGAAKTTKCWWCRNTDQSIMHLYTKC